MPPRPHAAACLALALVATGCHTRGLFKHVSYPGEVTAVPGQDRYHILAMDLRGQLMTDYDDAPAATSCVVKVIADDESRRAILRYAGCATQASTAGCPPADPVAPWPEASTLYDRAQNLCAARISPPDRVRLVDAVLSATASGARWLHSDMGRPFPARSAPPVGESCVDVTAPQGVRELFCGLEAAARGALSLEPSDPDHKGRRPELPALVLSGGSANGAFTAGYVYELLRLREAALGWYADEPEVVAGIHRSAGFSAIVSTSVGTLVALPVDRYYVSDALADEAAAAKGRRWALETLRKRFVAEEGDLLCARSWNPLAVLFGRGDPVDSLLDFQPMRAMIEQEMFPGKEGLDLVDGGPIRVALSVDARTTMTNAGDERACRPKGTDTAATEAARTCLVNQVMASITLPVFARGITDRLPLGLPEPPPGTPGRGGPGGLYFDGGVKSGTPAVSALAYTRGRLLAISNHRLSGAPRVDLDGLPKLAFRSIDLFTDVVREREIDEAELLVHDRDARRAALATRLGARMVGDADLAVLSAHIPFEAHPEIGAEGYTFDPAVMLALFRWGQLTLTQNAPDVLWHLGHGWALVASAPELGPELERRRAWLIGDMAARDNAWSDPGWRASHQVQRRKALAEQMAICPREPEGYDWHVPRVDEDPTFAPEEDETPAR